MSIACNDIMRHQFSIISSELIDLTQIGLAVLLKCAKKYRLEYIEYKGSIPLHCDGCVVQR